MTGTPIPADTRESLLAEHTAWRDERADYSAADGTPDGPDSGDWEQSDDTGCDLADRFASLLATDSVDVARDLATDALKHLIRLHLAADDGDNQDLAFAINGVIRDAYTETLDADSPDTISDTPRADLLMDLYPSWPQLEDALDDARAITREA